MTKRAFEMAKSFKKDLKKHYSALIGEEWTEIASCLLNGILCRKNTEIMH